MKEKILDIIMNANDYISGEEIANELNVSRTAIWKHIKTLRNEGYVIEAVNNRGYILKELGDRLSAVDIKPYLKTKFLARNIEYHDSLDSSNNYIKRAAASFEDGTVVIAEEQTHGRGRVGRNWASPSGKGLWFSMILRPGVSPKMASELTLVAAAAVWKALKTKGIEAGIKWPNDILISGKKVLGILTEITGELGTYEHVILGIGINVNLEKEDFPEELKETASSLMIETGRKISRQKLLAEILNNMEELYYKFLDGDMTEVIEISKKNSILLGKNIEIIYGDKRDKAKAVDIDNEGNLIIERENGKVEKISYGEISVREEK